MGSDLWRFGLLGLGSGALYVVSAMGLVLVHRGSGVVNFAHGAMGMVGTFVWYELRTNHGWPTWLAIVAGVAASGVLGGLTHVVVMRPLRHASAVTKIIGTLAVLAVLQSAAALRYPSEVMATEAFLPTGTVSILGASIGIDRVVIFVLGLSLSVLLWFVYQHTNFGLTTTAVSENRQAAAALGASPDRVAIVNWGVGAGLASLSGIMLAPIVGLGVVTLTLLVVPTLAAAVVGRFSSFPLTAAAGLVIGVLQSEAIRFQQEIWDLLHHQVAGIGQSLPFLLTVVVLIARGSTVARKGEAGARLPSIGTGTIRPVPIAIFGLVSVAAIWLWLPPDWVSAFLTQLSVAVVVLSVVVVTGYAGQLSLCQWSMSGFAAFVAVKVAAEWGVPFLLCIVIGAAATIPVSLLLGLAGSRTRGINLAIVTLGAGVVIQSSVLLNGRYTGGLQGLSIEPPSLFGIDINAITHLERYATFALVTFVALALGVANLRRGRVGRRLIAVRANERAAASLGISVRGAKLYAFSLAGTIAGVGGILVIFRERTASFTTTYGNAFKSIAIVQEAVLGGLGWIAGALMGAGLEPGTLGSRILDALGSGPLKYLILFAGSATVFALAVRLIRRGAMPPAVARSKLVFVVVSVAAAALLRDAPSLAVALLAASGAAAVGASRRVPRRADATGTVPAALGLAGVAALLAAGLMASSIIDWRPNDVDRYLFLIGGLLLLLTILHNQDGLAAATAAAIDASRTARRTSRRPRPAPPPLGQRTLLAHAEAGRDPRQVAPKVLEVEGLSVVFGATRALTDVDLVLRPGQVLGLIGPNGAGKTTAIDAITGFVEPSHGRIGLNGQDVAGWWPERRARAGLGRSFQQLELFDDMTVFENLLAACEPRDFGAYFTDLLRPGRPALTDTAVAAIREFGLGDDLDRRPTELSYGKRRLVAIARSVAASPSIILLDEPAAGLDDNETRELGRLIRRLADEWRMGVLLIEHDVGLVMSVSDTIVALHLGECIGAGTPEAIRDDQRVIEAYLGAPATTASNAVDCGRVDVPLSS